MFKKRKNTETSILECYTMAVNYLSSVPRLTGRENYSDWAFAVENVFVLEGLTKCLDGSETDSVVVSKAKAKLILTVDPTLFIHVKDTKSAKDVWDKLKKLYEDSGFARKISLVRKLISLRLENCESMESYVNQIIDTAQKLERSAFKLTEEFIGSLMLAGLTDKYEPMVIAIEHSGIDITADSIKSKLLDMHLDGVSGASTSSAGSAFASNISGKWNHRNDSGRGNSGNNGKHKNVNKGKSEVICYRCKKMGHFMNRCPEKKAYSKDNTSSAFNAVFLTGKFEKSDWYIDSGCSAHLTAQRNCLKNVREVPVKEITVANENSLAIECGGDTELTTLVKDKQHLIKVNDVFYVPDLMTNLLSVSQLIKNNNRVVFHKTGCNIFNSKNELVATASLVGNVYKLDIVEPHTKLVAGLAVSGEIWHRRFGHLNYKYLNSMKNGLVEGFDYTGSLSQSDSGICEICCQGKQMRLPFNHKGNRAKSILEVIHGDLCGPMEVTSIGGSRYFMILEDDYTRMVFTYFLKSKDEAFEKFKEFKEYVENQKGERIKVFRTDQGTEFDGKFFQEYYKNQGILHQQTNAYTPQQNGMSERMNRTIVEKARCLLYDAELEKKIWAEAVATAVYLRNRSVVSGLKKTPYEMWFNKRPDVSGIRIFGSKTMTLVPKEKRQKWDKKSEKMFLVGYSDNIKGYRLYDPIRQKIIISRDVVIEESIRKPRNIEYELQEVSDSVGAEVSQPDNSTDESFSDAESIISSSDEDFITELPTEECVEVRKSQRIKKPMQFEDYVTYVCIQEENPNDDAMITSYDDPITVKEAMASYDAKLWKEAMCEEIQCFEDNEAWELVDNLPDSSTVVPCKWVFKRKTSENGDVKHRARLVAKGCVQKAGVDYSDVFSPVVRHSTLRLLIALAVKLNLKITHLDVKAAFLNGVLDQPVYMKQPEGFVVKNQENKVYRLKKAVYGLKQASRAWNARVNEVLSKMGYKHSQHEPCLFIKRDKNSLTLVALYVDDFFVFSDNSKNVDNLKSKLSLEFDIKDLGEAKQCLGVRLTRDYKRNAIFLDQENYIDKVLKSFGMENCNVVSTPMESKANVEKIVNSSKNLCNLPYQQLIGSLMYLAVLTRPDITFAVNYLSQFNNNFSEYHWQCAKRVLRYLKGTKGYRLEFSNVSDHFDLEGFVDSDWANDCDRKSYTGYVFKLCGGSISWQSCKQRTVALSSTEAEYIGLSEASKEAVYLKNILGEIIDFHDSVTIYNDSQSAQKLALNPLFHKRTKHIDVRYHFVRECITNGMITIHYQQTDEMVADILTKGLARIKHSYFVKKLGFTS